MHLLKMKISNVNNDYLVKDMTYSEIMTVSDNCHARVQVPSSPNSPQRRTKV